MIIISLKSTLALSTHWSLIADLPRSGRLREGMCQQWLQTGLSWHCCISSGNSSFHIFLSSLESLRVTIGIRMFFFGKRKVIPWPSLPKISDYFFQFAPTSDVSKFRIWIGWIEDVTEYEGCESSCHRGQHLASTRHPVDFSKGQDDDENEPKEHKDETELDGYL